MGFVDMIRFDMQQQADPASAFMQGFQNARAFRQQVATDNALARYAQNPNDEGALSALTIANPQLGLGLRREARQEAYQTRYLDQQQAAQQAKAQADQLEAAKKAVGQAALGILRLPEAQRAAAFDAQIDQLSQTFPGLAQYRGRYSPTLLDAALAEAGLVDDAIDLTSPKYQVAPPGGGLINTNPLSPGFDAGAVAPDGYDALPPGYAPAGGAGSGPRNFP
jgi:hypothetical protein